MSDGTASELCTGKIALVLLGSSLVERRANSYIRPVPYPERSRSANWFRFDSD